MYTGAVLATFSILTATVALAQSESHTFFVTNKCGKGTPTLFLNGSNRPITIPSGGTYTAYGPVDSFNAFLQDGSCGTFGNMCPYVAGMLENSGISHASLYLLAGLGKFTVPTGFEFQGGGSACDGKGQECASPSNCPAVNILTSPGDPFPVHYPGVNCTRTDVGIALKFCD